MYGSNLATFAGPKLTSDDNLSRTDFQDLLACAIAAASVVIGTGLLVEHPPTEAQQASTIGTRATSRK